MQNAVPSRAPHGDDADAPLALRSVTRSLADRQAAYAAEVQRLIDAAYTVMRTTGSLEPRVSDIVRQAGLSNQAFYRHFRGKDELLLAVLDDGERRLLEYLERRLGPPPRTPAEGRTQVRKWIEGVMAQARNPEAAANTRPFAIHRRRLDDLFPEETARTHELLLAPLRSAIAAAGGDPAADPQLVYHLTMGEMHLALLAQRTPTADEVEHMVRFALRGVGGDPDGATTGAAERSDRGT